MSDKQSVLEAEWLRFVGWFDENNKGVYKDIRAFVVSMTRNLEVKVIGFSSLTAWGFEILANDEGLALMKQKNDIS